jgi:hypothetical protein
MKKMNQHDRLDRLSDALFGPPGDLDVEEAAVNLRAAGIEPADVCRRMYARLCLTAQAYRLKQEPLPPLLKKALDDLRQYAANPKTQEDLDRGAISTISHIIDAVKTPFAVHSQLSNLVLSPAFRNKKAELSAKDQSTMDRLEKELLEDLAREEKDNQG